MGHLKTVRIFAWLLVIMVVVLLIGTCGFHFLSNLSWIDSFHNASMYASGMGPLFTMKTHREKVFSSLYTLIAGVLFISIAAAFIQQFADTTLFDD